MQLKLWGKVVFDQWTQSLKPSDTNPGIKILK